MVPGEVVLAAVAVAAVVAAAVGWLTGRAWSGRERQQLRWRVEHDPLTGLLNRWGFAAAATSLLVAARGRPRGVLVVDLDGFKAVNDGHGHAAGDAVLRQVGAELARHAEGRNAAAGRLGGDEFVLVLAATADSGEIAAAAEELSWRLSRLYVVPGGGGGRRVWVGAAVGAAVVAPGRDADLSELLECADFAMYAAKRTRAGGPCRGTGAGRHTAADGRAPEHRRSGRVPLAASTAGRRASPAPAVGCDRRTVPRSSGRSPPQPLSHQ